jgi:tetratricopeptide (TPR) repeat protein
MQLSLVLIERDSLESAIGYLTRLKREAPRQWMPPYLLGFSWKKRGDFQRAFINYLESMERCGAASFEPYFGMGVLLFQKGKLHSAKSLFTRSISIDPLRAEAYFNRASISLLQNKPDSALRDFRAALRLKPGMGAAHERLAGIFAAKGIEDSAAFHRRQAGSAGSGKDVGILEEKNNFSRFTAPF